MSQYRPGETQPLNSASEKCQGSKEARTMDTARIMARPIVPALLEQSSWPWHSSSEKSHEDNAQNELSE